MAVEQNIPRRAKPEGVISFSEVQDPIESGKPEHSMTCLRANLNGCDFVTSSLEQHQMLLVDDTQKDALKHLRTCPSHLCIKGGEVVYSYIVGFAEGHFRVEESKEDIAATEVLRMSLYNWREKLESIVENEHSS